MMLTHYPVQPFLKNVCRVETFSNIFFDTAPQDLTFLGITWFHIKFLSRRKTNGLSHTLILKFYHDLFIDYLLQLFAKRGQIKNFNKMRYFYTRTSYFMIQLQQMKWRNHCKIYLKTQWRPWRAHLRLYVPKCFFILVVRLLCLVILNHPLDIYNPNLTFH